ncbi:class I SAM-dependent methyltransferase [Clostridiaceae bacterium M8S5]|nr:class I SAM-dependent methyltransferase [Clostridiaceae bacterium M8S5]
MKNKILYDKIKDYLNVDFKGWDFSYISDKMKEFPLPWNYAIEVEKHLHSSNAMLDMGTGGGEFLYSLKPLPKLTCATEGYKPNIKIARDNLKPLGIKVFEVNDDENLPFDDSKFDLVINRHESFNANEVSRIMKKDGIFITQQVGGMNDSDINSMFGAKQSEYLDICLCKFSENIKSTKLTIVKEKECLTKVRFYDVCALAYYLLKCIPWQIKDFSVDKYFDKLVYIDNVIKRQDYIDFISHRFMIIAQK